MGCIESKHLKCDHIKLCTNMECEQWNVCECLLFIHYYRLVNSRVNKYLNVYALLYGKQYIAFSKCITYLHTNTTVYTSII